MSQGITRTGVSGSWIVEWRARPTDLSLPSSDTAWSRYEFSEYEAKCLVAAKQAQAFSPCAAPGERVMEYRARPKKGS